MEPSSLGEAQIMQARGQHMNARDILAYLDLSKLDRLLYKRLGKRYIHWRSQKFWRGATYTFFASQDYYDRQENFVRSVLSAMAEAPARVLDIGCGSGRYSFVFAETSRSVVGYDISEQLIEQANAEKARRDMRNIEFAWQDIAKDYPEGEFDLTSCMGVLAAVVSQRSFDALTANLAKSTRAGGYLLTKDSLNTNGETIHFDRQYVAIYRNQDEYEQRFRALGFSLVERATLMQNEAAGLFNYIYLWQKRS
jgi:SAM-dependent methyltransferase